MESVDSAWRDRKTTCNYKSPVIPGSTGLQSLALVPQGSFSLCAADFHTVDVLSQFHAWSPRLAHLQVDDSLRAVALHGVELQVPLEVLGVETRDGQTVAKASLHTDRERERRGMKGLRRLCSLSQCKQQHPSITAEQTGLLSNLL